MVKENIESAFPNVEISLRMLLSLIVTNCSAERHKLHPNRTTMRQEKLDSLSPLMIEADLLHKINFDAIIKDFARHKSIKNYFKL